MSDANAFRPATLDELREMVAAAADDDHPLEIIGHGTKRGYGRPIERAHRVDLGGLAGIDMYEPEELVMSAGAGTPLAEIEAQLTERGQELAFEPADYGAILGGEPARQTIGGVFACNLSGPRRIKAGAARDHLLGLNCVTGYGQAIKSGGRVVKNVTGYDLAKLLTGSFGTLAVLSHVTFKVLPASESVATLLIAGRDEPTLLACLREALKTPYDVSGAAMLPPLAAGRSTIGAINRPARSVACIRLEGPKPSVVYRADALQKLLAADGVSFHVLEDEDSRAFWQEVRDVRLLSPRRPLWRMSIAPSAAAELVGWFAELTHEYMLDWGGGLVWLALKDDWAGEGETLRRALSDRGGHATLVRAGEELRSRIDVFQPQPPPLRALTERVKRSFDPRGILNPGRMYAGI